MSALFDEDEPEVLDLDPPEPGVSDAAERERLLAATVAHAMAQDAQYSLRATGPRPLAQWWKWLLSMALVTVALLVLMVPPGWLRGPPPPTLGEEELERGLQAALTLQAGEVAAYWVREGRLPRALEEMERAFPGVRYVRSSNRSYQLVGVRPDGSTLVWDSTEPPAERLGLAQRWLHRPFFP